MRSDPGTYLLTHLLTIVAVILLCKAADAGEPGCKTGPGAPGAIAQLSSELSPVSWKIYGAPEIHHLDAQFIFEIKSMPSPVTVTGAGKAEYYSVGGEGYNLGAAGASASLAKANGLIEAISAPNGPMSYGAYLKQVDQTGPGMSTDSKFLYLSMLGTKLNDGYDHGMPNGDVSKDTVYANARAGGTTGGVCRHIHTLIADVATHLGFTDCGVHTGVWLQTLDGDPGGHAITHCRDPKSGEYFVVNYGAVIKTHQATLTEAIDISTRILAPMNGVSLVESQPGKVHVYEPRVARWVKDVIAGQAEFGQKPVIKLEIGNFRRTVGTDVLAAGNDYVGIKGFVISSEYTGSDGKYSVNAAGLSAKIEPRFKLDAKYLSEAGAGLLGFAGISHLSLPRISADPALNGQPWGHTAPFAGATAYGMARLNSVTGKLEIKITQMDLESDKGTHALGEVGASVSYHPPGSPLTLEAARKYAFAPGTVSEEEHWLPRSAYDKFTVMIDTRGPTQRVYLVSQTEILVMDGLEKMSAVAIKEKLKVAANLGEAGDVYVLSTASGTVANPSKDPFYEAPPAFSLNLGYEKSFGEFVQVGAKLGMEYNRPYFLFEDKGLVNPDSGKPDGNVQLTGQVWALVRL